MSLISDIALENSIKGKKPTPDESVIGFLANYKLDKLKKNSFRNDAFFQAPKNSAYKNDSINADFKRLKNYMSINENAGKYIKQHRYLLTLLFRILDKLKEYFPESDTTYSLRRTYSSEPRDNGVVLEIYTHKKSVDALKCLEKFEDDWWIDNLPPKSDNLVIDVMFE